MADDWKETQLSEVMTVTHGFAFPGEGIQDEPTNDILVTPGNFEIGGGFKSSKYKYFLGEVPSEFILAPGDLVVTMTDLSKLSDTLGYPAILPEPGGNRRFLHNQRVGKVIVRTDAKTKTDRRFLSYLMRTAEYRHEILAGATGTSIKHTSPSRILAYKTYFPPHTEQQAIACILGALDDKIELNRRRNQTLEGIARAIFQSWFVDFDPVKAKAAGRPPHGLDRNLASLFADRFEDSDFGRIPVGWNSGRLGQFFQLGLGGAWGKDVPDDNATTRVMCLRGIDCHALAEGQFPQIPVRWLSFKQANDRRLHDGTLLLEGSGSFCGRSVIWLQEYEQLLNGLVTYSNFCKRLDPLVTPSQSRVLWMHLRKAYREDGLAGFRVGTAFPNFDVTGLLNTFNVVCPPQSIAAAFEKLTKSITRIDLVRERQTLAALRDTLLPKLISGELRVPDAERIVGRAV